MTRSRGNNNAQFTYDFGIAIAQSTVNKITRLTGATLTLASAFYALKSTASKYVDTLRENTLRFGGVLSTMKAMEQAQDRLIKGQSYFSVDDQLRGMNQLMAAGINVGKNLDWINKAAHATGRSYAEFSGMIASAIQGNSQALVEAGLITQRATRMFDKYAANTVMRQQAILNFVKNHKGLMNAIKNDFETIQDQMTRIKGIWQGFLQSIVGKPNDPQSFYGQVVSSMRMVATSLARNMEQIKRYGYIIGQTLGWVIRQIGHFVVWVGKQVKKALSSVWTVTDNFQEQARSLLVWLEFWKLRVIDFFKEYGGAIKTVLKLLIAYKALKFAFVIGEAAILSVIRFRKEWAKLVTFMQVSNIGKLGGLGRLMSFRLMRKSTNRQILRFFGFDNPTAIEGAFVRVGMGIENAFRNMFSNLWKGFIALFKWSTWVKGAKFLFGLLRNVPAILTAIIRAGKALISVLLGSNPVGWIVLAITLLTVLYTKSRKFRIFVNGLFKFIWESLKFIWNTAMLLATFIMIGCKKVWGWFKAYIWEPVAEFFRAAWGWVGSLWKKFMNTAVGKWINDTIVEPLKGLFEWIVDAWNWIVEGIGKAVDWISGANNSVSQATKELAKKNGVTALPTIGGGRHDKNDDTNYLNSGNWGIGSTPAVSEPLTGNPMLSDAGASGGFNGGGNSTSMSFNSGAIQIIVQKGEQIDERVLAQKVRGVLNDMKREGDMRGGTI